MQSSLQQNFPGHRNDVKMHKLKWNQKLQALDILMLSFFKKSTIWCCLFVWVIFTLKLFSPFLAKFLRTFTLETEKSKVCHHNLISMVCNMIDDSSSTNQ